MGAPNQYTSDVYTHWREKTFVHCRFILLSHTHRVMYWCVFVCVLSMYIVQPCFCCISFPYLIFMTNIIYEQLEILNDWARALGRTYTHFTHLSYSALARRLKIVIIIIGLLVLSCLLLNARFATLRNNLLLCFASCGPHKSVYVRSGESI